MKKNNYVLGFAFTADKERVLLMEKNRPFWQKGLHNGIGGKIENGETQYEAMIRETKEEANIVVDWEYCGIMCGTNNDYEEFECHIFCAYNDNVLLFEQIEDEKLNLFKLPLSDNIKILDSVKYLLPFGKCEDRPKFIKIYY